MDPTSGRTDLWSLWANVIGYVLIKGEHAVHEVIFYAEHGRTTWCRHITWPQELLYTFPQLALTLPPTRQNEGSWPCAALERPKLSTVALLPRVVFTIQSARVLSLYMTVSGKCSRNGV